MGEVSLRAVRDALAKYLGGVEIREHSANRESPSNVRAEGAVKTIRDLMRVLKDQLEYSVGETRESKAVVMLWMVMWVAMLRYRHAVGKDERTGYERMKGRTCRMMVLPLGVKVRYKKVKS